MSVAFNRKELKHQVERFQIGFNNKLPIADNAPNEGIDWCRLIVFGIGVSEHCLNALEFFFVGLAGRPRHHAFDALEEQLPVADVIETNVGELRDGVLRLLDDARGRDSVQRCS